MNFSSNFKHSEEYMYSNEKRKFSRANFSVDIVQPQINNKLLSEISDNENPFFKAVNISEGGICIKTNIKLKEGDILSFQLKIQSNPSFNFVAEIKWIASEGSIYIIGCQFYSLPMYQIQAIREYVSKKYSPTLL